MASSRRWLRVVTTALVVLPLSLWAFWGSVELYFEGWGLPFPEPLFYLAPMAILWILGLAAVTWPRLGGWALIVVGGGLAVWVMSLQIRRGAEITLGSALTWSVVVLLPAVAGVFFLLEARRRNSAPEPETFVGRHGDQLVVLTIPILVLGVVSAFWLPTVLSRVDDGQREAVTIDTAEGTLEWAPQGPGWNLVNVAGGYPSWSSLARYGVDPVGLDSKSTTDATGADLATTCLCGYLTEDGADLADQWVGAWRMPTTAETVASLVRDRQTAGCVFDHATRTSSCQLTPDKETPLWAPDQSPIYLWTSDMTVPGEAEYVGYNGSVGSQPIDWGNPRHGYRCVRPVDTPAEASQ